MAGMKYGLTLTGRMDKLLKELCQEIDMFRIGDSSMMPGFKYLTFYNLVCDMSRKYPNDGYGVSIPTIRSYLNYLISNGYISVISRSQLKSIGGKGTEVIYILAKDERTWRGVIDAKYKQEANEYMERIRT